MIIPVEIPPKLLQGFIDGDTVIRSFHLGNLPTEIATQSSRDGSVTILDATHSFQVSDEESYPVVCSKVERADGCWNFYFKHA